MKNTKQIPIDRINEILDYRPDSGEFSWKPRGRIDFRNNTSYILFNAKFAGKRAGNLDCKGYIRIGIDGLTFYAHRLAWAVYYGEWPGETIDHSNGDRTDNRIRNLRSVPKSSQSKNRGINYKNTSGHMGIHFCDRRGKWIARIGDNGRRRVIGGFHEYGDAVKAREDAERELGYHKNHGKRRSF